MTIQELNAAGVFDDMFNAIAAEYARKWAAADVLEDRDDLWHRQRALRDVRREFNKLAGLETDG